MKQILIFLFLISMSAHLLGAELSVAGAMQPADLTTGQLAELNQFFIVDATTNERQLQFLQMYIEEVVMPMALADHNAVDVTKGKGNLLRAVLVQQQANRLFSEYNNLVTLSSHAYTGHRAIDMVRTELISKKTLQNFNPAYLNSMNSLLLKIRELVMWYEENFGPSPIRILEPLPDA